MFDPACEGELPMASPPDSSNLTPLRSLPASERVRQLDDTHVSPRTVPPASPSFSLNILAAS